MTKIRGQWIVSEAALQSLAMAGIGLGWLKGWLAAAGAGEVAVCLLGSGTWRQNEAGWHIFFAEESRLAEIEKTLPPATMAEFELQNPPRRCRHLRIGKDRQILLLSLGDIAYQRQFYLSRLNPEPPLPLYVTLGDAGEMPLEPGLFASLSRPVNGVLNTAGLLPEEQVAAMLRRRRWGFRSVESCTAGAIAARLGRLPGISDVLDRAWITYSNVAKCREAGVDATLIEAQGAVSEPVARAMAAGGADARHVCLAVSGIAGPDGGTPGKPAGTVWMAMALPGEEMRSRCLRLAGSRSEIQARTVVAALAWLVEALA